MNKVILHGRVCRDVNLQHTANGKATANTAIAVNRRGKDVGADFINIVLWETTAETFARYMSKGREVLIEGHMQVRSYDDKNGIKRWVTEVIVDRFEFCGSKESSQSEEDVPF